MATLTEQERWEKEARERTWTRQRGFKYVLNGVAMLALADGDPETGQLDYYMGGEVVGPILQALVAALNLDLGPANNDLGALDRDIRQIAADAGYSLDEGRMTWEVKA